jgi:hypothetical protein
VNASHLRSVGLCNGQNQMCSRKHSGCGWRKEILKNAKGWIFLPCLSPFRIAKHGQLAFLSAGQYGVYVESILVIVLLCCLSYLALVVTTPSFIISVIALLSSSQTSSFSPTSVLNSLPKVTSFLPIRLRRS